LLDKVSVKISCGNEYTRNNRKTVGHGVSYSIRIVQNTQHVVKEKLAIDSSQNF
jgi:hypothetical protein